MGKCFGCSKDIEDYLNYCSWDCHVMTYMMDGGKIIAPNNLPIVCLRADGMMLEHHDADHADYKFPITVDVIADKKDDDEHPESHAFLYCSGRCILTIYECEYFIWHLNNGRYLGGGCPEVYHKRYAINKDSLKKIREWVDSRH